MTQGRPLIDVLFEEEDRMTTLDASQVMTVWIHSPVFRKRRRSSSPDDWGDQATVGAHLKRHGTTPLSPTSSFGIFLGRHPFGFVVAVFGNDLTRLSSGEVFEELDEAKSRWELD